MFSEKNKIVWENFVYNIIWIRKQYKLTKKDMAECMGIGVGSLNKIEKQVLPPRLSVRVVFNIEDSFGIPAKDLMGVKLGD